MKDASPASPYFIGWDVGGWNCDRNSKSRDAILILDSDLTIVGKPWRGNLRATINESATTRDWVCSLFECCEAPVPEPRTPVTLAIDTPLGFSEAFSGLVTNLRCVEPIGNSDTNPYLFRQTERYLFEHGLRPLSAVKDMIGSQATKGMHVLAKFAPKVARCGVWTDGAALTAIEAYPSACKESATIQGLRRRHAPLCHQDEEDALICALVARLFAEDPGTLHSPGDTVSASEGWIWVPADVIKQ